jgi:uncharacterized protein
LAGLAVEAHTHHLRAKAYWKDEAAPEVALCRVTHLAFLRHLTNRTIMGTQILSPGAAWKKCTEFLSLPEVTFLSEPSGLPEHFERYSSLGRSTQNLWTDAYLAAFAKSGNLRLVSFDSDFLSFKDLQSLILKA